MNEPTTISHADPMALNLAAFFGLGGDDPLYVMVGASALAEINVDGVLVPDWTMARVRDAAVKAKDDPNVAAVVLNIDCPGGYVRGMDDMVSALRELGAAKPVYAVTSRATSGGYWAACMAREIAATPNAVVGSIGVMGTVVYDTSKMLADKGIVPHVAASSDYKSLGVPGLPVTDEQMKIERDLVDDMAAAFFGDVSVARRMTGDQVKALNAAVMTGNRAASIGLVDRVVQSKAAYVAELATKYPAAAMAPAINPNAGRVPGTTAARAAGAIHMTESNTNAPAQDTNAQAAATSPEAKPAPATPEQLAAVIDDEAFCFKAIKSGWTEAKAFAEWAKHIKAQQVAQAAKPTTPATVPAVETGTRPNVTEDAPGSAVSRASEFFAACAANPTKSPAAIRDEMFSAVELATVTRNRKSN